MEDSSIAAAFGAKLCNLLVGATTAGQSFGEKALLHSHIAQIRKKVIKKGRKYLVSCLAARHN